MDKISKTIKSIDSKNAKKLISAMELLSKGSLKGLDVKKLKGHKDIFRVRVGNYRIIFKQKASGIVILHIGIRDDKTYKNLQSQK